MSKNRCKGTTKGGAQCKKMAVEGAEFCVVHAAMQPSVEPKREVAPARTRQGSSPNHGRGSAARFFEYWKTHDVQTVKVCCDRHRAVLVDMVNHANERGVVSSRQLAYARDIVTGRAGHGSSLVATERDGDIVRTRLGTYRVVDEKGTAVPA